VTEVCDCIHAFHGIYPNAVAERHLNIYLLCRTHLLYHARDTHTSSEAHTRAAGEVSLAGFMQPVLFTTVLCMRRVLEFACVCD
jgi:hypothetical protein